MRFATRTTGVFSVPAGLDTRAGSFAKVLIYDTNAASYHDATSASANDTVGDVYHPSSGALVSEDGDCVYFGMPRRFRLIHMTLATAGSGGGVSYSYWDGTAWKSFDPAGGTCELDSTDRTLLLWPDYHNIPGDWQQSVVDGSRLFWVKAEVTSGFTTPPVGTRLDALGSLTAWAVRR